mgnify:CR=1 FL=1
MELGNILSLFDRTGNMVLPWAEVGFNCYIVDIQHKPGLSISNGGHENIHTIGCDILTFNMEIKRLCMIFAFPPCTHLAVSGASHFKTKGLKKLIHGLQLVDKCIEICERYNGCTYMIENPIGTLSTYWRKPDYIFNPCDYAGYQNENHDTYTKATCLWVGNGFIMPKSKYMFPCQGSKMHLYRNNDPTERMNFRSQTPKGFAQAVFEANSPKYMK